MGSNSFFQTDVLDAICLSILENLLYILENKNTAYRREARLGRTRGQISIQNGGRKERIIRLRNTTVFGG